MAEDTKTLDVNSLAAGYGRIPILHGIDLHVGQGEIVGILGHNGMGKSTLLKTVMGFLPAHVGSIVFAGEEITRLKPHQRAQRRIGYIPQGRGIFPKLSVRDNLRFAWHRDSQLSEQEAFEEILSDFPRIRRLLDRDGGALSGGEQQLLALARGLMANPKLLLLDEPTEGIQPSIIEEMEETLLKLRKSRGLTILLVEQNFDFISALSDRVLILERGMIIAEFDAASLSDTHKIEEFLGFGGVRRTRGAVSIQTDATVSPQIAAAARSTSANGEASIPRCETESRNP